MVSLPLQNITQWVSRAGCRAVSIWVGPDNTSGGNHPGDSQINGILVSATTTPVSSSEGSGYFCKANQGDFHNTWLLYMTSNIWMSRTQDWATNHFIQYWNLHNRPLSSEEFSQWRVTAFGAEWRGIKQQPDNNDECKWGVEWKESLNSHCHHYSSGNCGMSAND